MHELTIIAIKSYIKPFWNFFLLFYINQFLQPAFSQTNNLQLTNPLLENSTQALLQTLAQQQQLPQSPNGTNQFVIELIHNDAQNGRAYVTIKKVNYTNLHEPRIDLRYFLKTDSPYATIDEKSPNGTVVAAVVAKDDDVGVNGQTTITIENGNELNHFKLVSTPLTNTVQVNGAPLNRQRVSEYNLTIVAKDHGTPPRSTSANLIIKLTNLQPLPTAPDPSAYLTTQNDLMYIGTVLVFVFFCIVVVIICGCALAHSPKRKKASHTSNKYPLNKHVVNRSQLNV